jgi:uncharacterized protein YjiS (DUF1127 family)
MRPSAPSQGRSAAQAIALPRPAPAGAGVAEAVERIGAVLQRIAETYRRRRARRHSIQALGSMSDHALKDIGIHRSEIVSRIEAKEHRAERRRRYAGR